MCEGMSCGWSARIHQLARDYGVEGTPNDLIENCEICPKLESASPTGVETPDQGSNRVAKSAG